MAEYIERNDAIEAAKHAWSKGLEPSQYMEIIPSADVAPVRHGHWNAINQITTGLPWKYRCNDCGCPQEYTHNYCPNCGAKMDGGHDG